MVYYTLDFFQFLDLGSLTPRTTISYYTTRVLKFVIHILYVSTYINIFLSRLKKQKRLHISHRGRATAVDRKMGRPDM